MSEVEEIAAGLSEPCEYGNFNRKHQYPCKTCGGAGWTEARLLVSMPEINAMVDAGLGDLPVPIEHQRCPACQGSGGGAFKSQQATAFADVNRAVAAHLRKEKDA